MRRWEIIAACERFGVPNEDHRAIVDLIRVGRATRRLVKRFGEYEPCVTEILTIIHRRERRAA